MATPRAVSFKKIGKELVEQGGQTSTQIVLLKKPIPESYMIIPLGQSDHEVYSTGLKLTLLLTSAFWKPLFCIEMPILRA